MKKYFIALVVILLVLFNLSFAQVGSKVYINRVNSVDGGLIEPAKIYLMDRLRVRGFDLVNQKEEADYILDLNIVSVNSRRSFNWLILILPAWPLVPFTTVQGEAIVAIRVYDKAGNEVVFDQTGAVRNGMWFFGDFVTSGSVIRGAVNDCINILVSRFSLK